MVIGEVDRHRIAQIDLAFRSLSPFKREPHYKFIFQLDLVR